MHAYRPEARLVQNSCAVTLALCSYNQTWITLNPTAKLPINIPPNSGPQFTNPTKKPCLVTPLATPSLRKLTPTSNVKISRLSRTLHLRSRIPQLHHPHSLHSPISTMLAARFTRSAIPRAGSARSYAVAAASQSVKPPVQLFGIDGTYASALVP